jgi:hypothetical protein
MHGSKHWKIGIASINKKRISKSRFVAYDDPVCVPISWLAAT